MKTINNQNFYETSGVMRKYFRNEPLTIHDIINFKTIYVDGSYGFKRYIEYIQDLKTI